MGIYPLWTMTIHSITDWSNKITSMYVNAIERLMYAELNPKRYFAAAHVMQNKVTNIPPLEIKNPTIYPFSDTYLIQDHTKQGGLLQPPAESSSYLLVCSQAWCCA